MEVADLEEALKVVDACASRIKWRLKAAAKRRLHIDILALCTGLRPVVMVDYGGKLPELQENLCSVLQLSQKEVSILGPLRVMIIEDMIYLIHVRGFAQHVKLSLNSELKLLLVDLEQDPPKMMEQSEQNPVAAELVSVQRFFSTVFPFDEMDKELFPSPRTDCMKNNESPIGELNNSQSSDFIDLSSCMQDSEVTIPTLNGWLLGYPVVYLFGKEHIANAIYNLSTKSLRLFKIVICSSCGNGIPYTGAQQSDELMSFSVPYDLSMEGKNEPWAETFLAHMLAKFESCKHVWTCLQMENLALVELKVNMEYQLGEPNKQSNIISNVLVCRQSTFSFSREIYLFENWGPFSPLDIIERVPMDLKSWSVCEMNPSWSLQCNTIPFPLQKLPFFSKDDLS